MTHFYSGPRFCEMKTVKKIKHIPHADWVIRTLQSCGHAPVDQSLRIAIGSVSLK